VHDRPPLKGHSQDKFPPTRNTNGKGADLAVYGAGGVAVHVVVVNGPIHRQDAHIGPEVSSTKNQKFMTEVREEKITLRKLQ